MKILILLAMVSQLQKPIPVDEPFLLMKPVPIENQFIGDPDTSPPLPVVDHTPSTQLPPIVLDRSDVLRTGRVTSELRTAIDDVDAWLNTSVQGPGWKRYLQLTELKNQSRDTRIAVRQVRITYEALGKDHPGLENSPFRKLELALHAWLYPSAANQPPRQTALNNTGYSNRGIFRSR
jgi:hypothetical protein